MINTLTAEKCIECGLCKANCPVFKSLRNESVSARGKAILIKKGIMDNVFYKCTLCKACKTECPVGIDLEFEEIRGKLIKHKIETTTNKRMIKNIKQYGNPFGKINKDKIPKELYCC